MQLHPLNTICNNSSLPQFPPSVSLYLLPIFSLLSSSSSSSSSSSASSSSLYQSLSCLIPSPPTPTFYTILPHTQTAWKAEETNIESIVGFSVIFAGTCYLAFILALKSRIFFEDKYTNI
ncbi:hypothetical protein F383_01181 [Gossypium arboreum]|uniref:Uncharacterized protein n=1 Tax=Gossypium arboreum TaxID=29729 RepID=A0A0B0MRQ5_GOSAR|nr:hypothetical protein F383_26385 [Gossypium arboreum]KHG23277.1 hypothetical protein F383_01181 [Gossypium arboreum]